MEVIGDSHRNPTGDDSQDTGKRLLLQDVGALKLRSIGSYCRVHPRLSLQVPPIWSLT